MVMSALVALRRAATPHLRNPVFQLGLVVRVGLILLVSPATHQHWFAPFVEHGLQGEFFDPWTSHLNAGGDSRAFPYGWTMFAVLATPTLVLGAMAIGWTLLAVDLLLYTTITRLRPNFSNRILALYWLSPIVIYICYWHGQLDIIPVFFLTLSVALLLDQIWAGSAVAMAVALSAKFSMALALPVVLLFLAKNKQRRALFWRYALTTGILTAALSVPVALSPTGRAMVFGTPEIGKIYDLSVALPSGLQIYFVPIFYVVLLFATAQIRRISPDLLLALLGLGFLAIVILTPASPGWYMWALPFLVATLVKEELTLSLFVILYGWLFAAFHLVVSSGASLPALGLDFSRPILQPPYDAHIEVALSLSLTFLFGIGVVLCVTMLQKSILHNDYFRLSQRPILIGVAGDSGVGKDTLAQALIDMLGAETVTHVSGDDYHQWDRHKPIWRIITHLNPRANDLLGFKQDILTLASGHSIRSRQYDHEQGRKTKERTVASSEFIVATGLHALYDSELNSRFDVKIFLDMDEDLRRFFKMRRDTQTRGHDVERIQKSLKQREPDREKFILPQSANADLVFRLLPLRPGSTLHAVDGGPTPRLKLRVRLMQSTPYESLIRTLIGVCGVHAEVLVADLSSPVEIELEGDVDADDVSLAAHQILEEIDDGLFALQPNWKSGPAGLMQLFAVNQVIQAMKRRLT
jgi:uridine kinase